MEGGGYDNSGFGLHTSHATPEAAGDAAPPPPPAPGHPASVNGTSAPSAVAGLGELDADGGSGLHMPVPPPPPPTTGTTSSTAPSTADAAAAFGLPYPSSVGSSPQPPSAGVQSSTTAGMVARPILRGRITEAASLRPGMHNFEGEWAMAEMDTIWSHFKYTFTLPSTPPTFTLPPGVTPVNPQLPSAVDHRQVSGPMTGYFNMLDVEGQPPSRKDERGITVRIGGALPAEAPTVVTTADGVHVPATALIGISGEGSYRGSKYTLAGAYHPASGTAWVRKVYEPLRAAQPKAASTPGLGTPAALKSKKPVTPAAAPAASAAAAAAASTTAAMATSTPKPPRGSSMLDAPIIDTPRERRPVKTPRALEDARIPGTSRRSQLPFELRKCHEILYSIKRDRSNALYFLEPVDPVKHNAPSYFDVIKHPMDLGTIGNKLDTGKYLSPDDFAADMRLVFDNAMIFNPAPHVVHSAASALKAAFDERWAAFVQERAALMEADAAAAAEEEKAARAAEEARRKEEHASAAAHSSAPTPAGSSSSATSSLASVIAASKARDAAGLKRERLPDAEDSEAARAAHQSSKKARKSMGAPTAPGMTGGAGAGAGSSAGVAAAGGAPGMHALHAVYGSNIAALSATSRTLEDAAPMGLEARFLEVQNHLRVLTEIVTSMAQLQYSTMLQGSGGGGGAPALSALQALGGMPAAGATPAAAAVTPAAKPPMSYAGGGSKLAAPTLSMPSSAVGTGSLPSSASSTSTPARKAVRTPAVAAGKRRPDADMLPRPVPMSTPVSGMPSASAGGLNYGANAAAAVRRPAPPPVSMPASAVRPAVTPAIVPATVVPAASPVLVPLSSDEKADLASLVELLTPAQMDHAIRIVQEHENLNDSADAELELDMDSLQTLTLRELQRFVAQSTNKPLPPAALEYFKARTAASAAPGGAPTAVARAPSSVTAPAPGMAPYAAHQRDDYAAGVEAGFEEEEEDDGEAPPPPP